MSETNTNYKDYLQRIMDGGRVKTDRTGTGTLSIFGQQMRWNLSEGFPLETLKFTAFRLVKEELLWFIRGGTNAQDLIDVNCHIWDEWMVPEDVIYEVPLSMEERVELRAVAQGISLEEASSLAQHDDYIVEILGYVPSSRHGGAPNGAEHELNELGIPRTKKVVGVSRGALGPIYGAQWRSWPNYRGGTIDQLAQCIELLRTKPTSRRIVVSAWNPSDLPDETKSPQDNAAAGYMALAPCHTLFQFMAEPLTAEEISKYTDASNYSTAPKYRLSCQLYQRSVDSTLGLPFNIASYALLTQLVAQSVNMVPGDFVWTGGDCHIYLNHLEQNGPILTKLNANRPQDQQIQGTPDGEGVETLLQRDPLPYPTVRLNPDIRNIDDFTSDDITLVGYQHCGKMTFPIAV